MTGDADPSRAGCRSVPKQFMSPLALDRSLRERNRFAKVAASDLGRGDGGEGKKMSSTLHGRAPVRLARIEPLSGRWPYRVARPSPPAPLPTTFAVASRAVEHVLRERGGARGDNYGRSCVLRSEKETNSDALCAG